VTVSEDGWLRAIDSGALGDSRPLGVNVRGRELVLLRTESGAKAYAGVCPHQGGLLAGGDLRGGALVCQNHGWAFDAETGERRGGAECLQRFACEEKDGALWVLLPVVAPTADAPPSSSAVLRSLDALPGPPGLPWVGNAHQLDVERLHLVFEGWAREYGKLYRVRVPGQDMVVISEPRLAESVLRRRPLDFRRGARMAEILRELDCEGVFSAEGDAWRAQRELVMDALAARNLRTFYPQLVEITERLLGRWREAAAQGRVLDLHQEAMRFTVDVTTRLALGRDLDSIQRGGDELQHHLEVLFEAMGRRLFAVAPLWRWLPTPEQRRVKRALAALHAWLDPLIEEIQTLQSRDPERAAAPQNLLEAMVATRAEDGSAFPREVLFANALVMLIGGEDTTASTIAWAVHELCENTAATQQVEAEADALLGADDVARDLQSLDGAGYMLAVAHETTRLRPVVPLLLCEANSDQTLGDLAIPAGTAIMLLLRLPAIDPAAVDDPERFDPARWIDRRKSAQLYRDARHTPFGSGPRMCPARSLALIEIRLVLSMLYKNFHVQRVGARADVVEAGGFTMEPRGVTVRLESR